MTQTTDKRISDLFLFVERNYFKIGVPPVLEGLLSPLEDMVSGSLEGMGIDRPIFLVGAHRSGTTVTGQVLCTNKDFFYFSNASDIFPELPILSNYLSKALDGQFWGMRSLDAVEESLSNPNEGIKMFERYIENRRVFYRMGKDYNNAQLEAYLKVSIVKHQRYFGGKRFLNKNPYNSNRTPWLKKIFSDAKFVVIVRDPRAQICSGVAALAMVTEWHERWRDWQGIYQDLITANNLVGYPADLAQKSPVEFCAWVWRALQEIMTQDQKQMLDGNTAYQWQRYEDFLVDPKTWLYKFHEFCELPTDPGYMSIYDQAAVKLDLSKAEGWRTKLKPEEIALIESICGDWMDHFGYERVNKV